VVLKINIIPFSLKNIVCLKTKISQASQHNSIFPSDILKHKLLSAFPIENCSKVVFTYALFVS
jgi:hypothetical protein